MKQYVVDAFSDRVFSGNPAAVCLLDRFPEDEKMCHIAMENCLSETAFAVPDGEEYVLRWFTPAGEIDLCGHATLATAYVVLRFAHPEWNSVSFNTMSGKLTVVRKGDLLEMDFPAYRLTPVPVTDQMEQTIGARPIAAFMGRDLLCVLDREEAVRSCAPSEQALLSLDGLLLHITAAGSDYDCVSRSFGPKCGIYEDPVCGSGHCHIVPYWADVLKRDQVLAYQASKRGGVLHCEMAGDRVRLAGQAVLYAASEIFVD
ncbi:MAG: PhzF family phenazine biosynthesis protein [Clostridia bacterium]|nr:PhzF family phenazine biosynthesis protein [Clostridia bacterium]